MQAFRDRYPDAQMMSDLLLVERDRFVVKVTITTSSSGGASGLAAHTAIEVAEDQARLRAMAAMGDPSTGSPAATSSRQPERTVPIPAPDRADESSHPEQISGTPAPTVTAVASAPSRPELEQSATAAKPPVMNGQVVNPEKSSPKPARVITTPRKVEKIHYSPSDEPDPLPISLDGDDWSETIAPPEVSIPPPEPQPETTADPIPAETLPAPINLSDVIAQTDIELRRLGWSVETGRDYLEQTYQKRSRHELSEEELIQFLCHLESL